jgi:micrococcal nuclease
MEPAYTYKATVVRWVDGDTVDLKVDLGFYLTFTDRFRLYGIDTPERGQVHHDEAWHFAQQQAPEGSQVVVATYPIREKYGRFLADIHPAGADDTVNGRLVAAQLAKPYFGGTKQ